MRLLRDGSEATSFGVGSTCWPVRLRLTGMSSDGEIVLADLLPDEEEGRRFSGAQETPAKRRGDAVATLWSRAVGGENRGGATGAKFARTEMTSPRVDGPTVKQEPKSPAVGPRSRQEPVTPPHGMRAPFTPTGTGMTHPRGPNIDGDSSETEVQRALRNHHQEVIEWQQRLARE